MMSTSVLISSADPVTGEPIAVIVDGSDSAWRPATAVVFVGRTADQCAGRSAAICCSYINFFASRRSPGHVPGPIPKSTAAS